MRSTLVSLACFLILFPAFTGCSTQPSPSGSQIVKGNKSGDIDLPRDDAGGLGLKPESPAKAASRDDGGFTFENPFEPAMDDAAEGSGIVGRWLLTIPHDLAMVSRPYLLEFTGSDEAYEAKILERAVPIETGISGLKKSEDRVTFNLLIDEQPCSFEGTLVEGRILGTLDFKGQTKIAWLDRTKLKRLSGTQIVVPVPGLAEYDAAQRLSDPKQLVKELQLFAERSATSPLVFDALQTVLRVAKVAELSETEVRAVTEKYLELARPWGPRWAGVALESIAYVLATSEANRNVALDFAEKAKAALPEDAVAIRRQSVQFSLAVALLRNDRADESKVLLDELREQAGDDDDLRFYSALVTEKLDDMDGAVDALVAQWPEPRATRELERIWKTKHDGRTGLDARLDAEYLKRFPPIAVEPYAGRTDDAASRVAVAELFTGANCPPCVAADLAFEALGRAFQRADLVLLEYHLHVPGPDPLTNIDSESRANYYNVPGTPVLFVNGKVIAPVYGSRREGEDRYNLFRGVVEKELRRKSDAKLELAATRNGDAIAIEVNLNGVAEPNDKLRLRLAIVEESVRFGGLNGLRLHHAVVRAMPGGADGVPVTEATLKHSATVQVADLRASLATALIEIEKEHSYVFPAKPLELEHLGVAALVQDDATKEVLQSAFVSLAPPAKPQPDAEQRPAAGAKESDDPPTIR